MCTPLRYRAAQIELGVDQPPGRSHDVMVWDPYFLNASNYNPIPSNSGALKPLLDVSPFPKGLSLTPPVTLTLTLAPITIPSPPICFCLSLFSVPLFPTPAPSQEPQLSCSLPYALPTELASET